MNKKPILIKFFSLIMLMFLFTGISIAQNREISGKVTDEEGPLPGVDVVIKGTTTGVITNLDGTYVINAPETAVLLFSYVGYLPQEIPVGSQTYIDILMIPDLVNLDEIVVVGYGTQRKSDIIGSVSSVNKERIQNTASINVLESVQGSSPGVYIRRSSGEPGSQADIRIRGINSIGASNSPLYVVDGIPFTSGNLNDISPNDIESIEILKDASAAAIYGSRSANGVVLITTRRGTAEGMRLEFSSSVLFEKIANKPELFSGEEYLNYKREANIAAGNSTDLNDLLTTYELENYQAGIQTDWLDELTRTAATQNYQLSLIGGTEKSKYYLSGSYTDQDGIVINSGYKRMSLKFNFDHKINDWLSLGTSMLITNSDYNPAEFGTDGDAAYKLSPYGKLKNDDGSYTLYPMYSDVYYSNVIADNMLKEVSDQRTRIFNNMFMVVELPFIKGLSYRLNYGLDIRYRERGLYWPKGTVEGESITLEDVNSSPVYGKASTLSSRSNSWTLENILNYKKEINSNNKIDFTAMVSRQDYDFSEMTAGAEGFISDDFLWYQLQAGKQQSLSESDFEDWRLLSAMGRLNYNLMDKYLLTLTGRSDGYSAFAENNKWSFFPSAGFAWKLSNEPFLSDIESIQSLKLRLSYGHSGNQAIDPYSSLAQLLTSGYVFGQTSENGVSPSSLANANLTWETTIAKNAAIDFALFRGRISGSFEYYVSNTESLLLSRNIPSMTGVSEIMDNIGSVKNRGIDIDFRTINISKKNFQWQTFFNVSKFKDEIVELYGDNKDDVGNNWFIGERINVYYTQEADGVWQTDDDIAGYLYNTNSTQLPKPGSAHLIDVEIDGERDGVIDADDRVIIGSPDPSLLLGMSNTFTYKGISLSIFVHSVHGNMRNVNIDGAGRFNTYKHNYWTETNPSNEYIRPNASGSTNKGSLYYHDASFFRVKDINLSYSVPKVYLNKTGIKGLDISVNARDIYTYTKFPGDDPEVGLSYRYPVPMSLLFGLKITM